MAARVHIADPLYTYAVRLAAATRDHPQVRVGVSPRGVIALTRAACAYALTNGRGYVLPEDLKALVGPVFAHRILLTPDAQLRGTTADEVLAEAIRAVPVPLPGGGTASGGGGSASGGGAAAQGRPGASGRASSGRANPVGSAQPATASYGVPAQANGVAHAAPTTSGYGTPAQANGVAHAAPTTPGYGTPVHANGAGAGPTTPGYGTAAQAQAGTFGFGGLRPLPGS
jgi:MoxR-like ATPase